VRESGQETVRDCALQRERASVRETKTTKEIACVRECERVRARARESSCAYNTYPSHRVSFNMSNTRMNMTFNSKLLPDYWCGLIKQPYHHALLFHFLLGICSTFQTHIMDGVQWIIHVFKQVLPECSFNCLCHIHTQESRWSVSKGTSVCVYVFFDITIL